MVAGLDCLCGERARIKMGPAARGLPSSSLCGDDGFEHESGGEKKRVRGLFKKKLKKMSLLVSFSFFYSYHNLEKIG